MAHCKSIILITFVLVLGLVGNAPGQTPADLQLWAEYLFDGPDPNADTSGKGYDIVNVGAGASVGVATGYNGTAYQGTASTSSYAIIPTGAWPAGGDVTIEMMINLDVLIEGSANPGQAFSSMEPLSTLNHYFQFEDGYRDGGNNFFMSSNYWWEGAGPDWEGYVATDRPFETGRWYHWVVSMDNTNKIIRHWFDGELVVTANHPGTDYNDIPYGENLYLGIEHGSFNFPLQGRLDNVRFYKGYTESSIPLEPGENFPGDLNGDCFVDFGDYSVIAAAWLSQDGDAQYNPYCDINPGGPDGFINARDVAVFADNWLIYTAPTPPSALTFDNITTNSIDISWTDNSPDEIGFYIYVSSSPNQPGVPTYTNSANDANLTAASLAPGTTYHFWVTAYNSYCESAAADGNQTTIGGPMYPMSDPNNTGNWILRSNMSDEFDGNSLDTDKWFKDGEGGVFMYSWPGRAPSQFAPENIRVENGKLYLTTKWDPNYPFVPEIDPDCGCPYENYTTAAVISNNTFQYGYMEIKCKAADVSITSSFWATGDSSELDVFEFVADSKVYDNDRTYPFCVHDWDHGGRSWCDSVELPWRVGSESHVYGCEWDANGLKFYADGNLVKDAPESEIGNVWCLDEQMIIWVDSEAFEWEGFPSPSELPADYEIDYIRVWQK